MEAPLVQAAIQLAVVSEEPTCADARPSAASAVATAGFSRAGVGGRLAIGSSVSTRAGAHAAAACAVTTAGLACTEVWWLW